MLLVFLSQPSSCARDLKHYLISLKTTVSAKQPLFIIRSRYPRVFCVITAFGSPKLLSLSQRTRGKHACSDGVCQTPRVLGICYSKTIQQETENRQYLGPTVEFN